MAPKVNDVIKLITGVEATFVDPEIAGSRLGAFLDSGPRRLLVIDDLWEEEQLAPFASGGRRCARLVTTRVPTLLGGQAKAVLVDQMSGDQARQLLTAGLPPLDPAVAGKLLAVTGRWPLLLRLVNKILANAAANGNLRSAAAQLLEQLQLVGPAAVDAFLGEDIRGLDVAQPKERARAVQATIGASTSLLSPQYAERFTELGVFAEDETIPFALVVRFWHATARLDELQTSQLCARLAELALVSRIPDAAGRSGVQLHDVVRDFLRGELGKQRLTALNDVLLGAVAKGLSGHNAGTAGIAGLASVPWWEMGPEDRYMWDHLIEHLLDAARPAEAGLVAGDLRWVGARVRESGPAAPAADLSLVGTSRAARLRTAVTRAAHLLAPTEPPEAVLDILHSRVAGDQDWSSQVAALRDALPRPRLVNRWPLPDLPDSALLRVLPGHGSSVDAIAVARDSSWLATCDVAGTVRIWDVATGRARSTLAGHGGRRVTALEIAPDNSWLATGSTDGTARIWDASTGQEQIVLDGHHGWVSSVVIAPDGSWLATSDESGIGGKIRIWDAATGRERGAVTGRRGHQMAAVAIAPDGSWLAIGGTNGRVRVIDTATRRPRVTLSGHRGRVDTVVAAPDGRWLATGDTGTVRIWDTASWRLLAGLADFRGRLEGLAIAPDGMWLATFGDGTVRIWDAATGRKRATLTSNRDQPTPVVAIAPDGSWLATGGADGVVCVWDAATARERATFTGHNHAIVAVAVAPDGSWLATGDSGGTVRIWDPASRRHTAAQFARNRMSVTMMAAPDGSWLMTIGGGTARIWDAATGQERGTFTHQSMDEVPTVAIAPDSNWLAIVIDGMLRIWEPATGRVRATLSPGKEVSTVAIAPDSSWLAVGDMAGTTQIWDAVTGQPLATLCGQLATLRSRRGYISAVVIAPDGSWLATCEIGGDGVRGESKVRIWNAATWDKRDTVISGRMTIVAIAPDSSWLATLDDGVVRIWDALTGDKRATITRRKRKMVTMMIAPDSNWLATTDDHGGVTLWDAATGRARATLAGQRGKPDEIEIAPDSSWLVTMSGGIVRIWNSFTGQERVILSGHQSRISAMAVTSDGHWVAGVEDATVRIWETGTGRSRALMRVENAISAFVLVGAGGIAATSWAGLYMFDFLADS